MDNVINLFKKFLNGNEKNKEITMNVLGGLFIKGFSMILSFFSLPLHISFFDNQAVLGVWYTLLSVLSWVNMFDFGLTNGLRNSLVNAIEKKDSEKINKLFSSTSTMLTVISLICIFIFVPLIYCINLNVIFNISSSIVPLNILRLVASILIVGTMISFVLKTVTALNYAMQKSALNNVCTFTSTVIPLLLMLILSNFNLSLNFKLFIMAFIYLLATWIPLLVVFYYSKIKYNLLAKLKFFCKQSDLTVAKNQLKIGGSFFVAQGAFLAITQTNEYLITLLFSPNSVVTFRAYNSLFLIVGSIFQVALAPVWSSVTKACVQKDFHWLNKLLKFLYFVAFVAIISEFIIVPLAPWIFKVWLGTNKVDFHYFVACVFGIYGGLYILNIILTTIANGMGQVKIQVIFYSLGAIIKIPIVLLLKSFNSNMWVSVVVANIIILSMFCLVQTVWLNKTLKKFI